MNLAQQSMSNGRLDKILYHKYTGQTTSTARGGFCLPRAFMAALTNNIQFSEQDVNRLLTVQGITELSEEQRSAWSKLHDDQHKLIK